MFNLPELSIIKKLEKGTRIRQVLTGALELFSDNAKNVYVQEIRHIATVLTNTNNLVLNIIRKLHSFKLLSANYCHSMALKTSLVLASSLKSGS